MKRILKWWPVLLVVVALVVGYVWYRDKHAGGAAVAAGEVRYFAVMQGTLIASISPTGQVYAPRSAELSFDVGKATLIELNVAPGRQVKAGDVLARIDTAALENAVLQAEAALTAAQDNLAQVSAPYTELDRLQATVAVTQAQVSLLQAQKNLEQAKNPYTALERLQAAVAVTQAEVALKEAQENLADVKAGPTEAELASAEAALKSAQTQYEKLLAAPDPDTVENAKLALDQAKNSLWSAQMNRDAVCGQVPQGGSSVQCDSAKVNVLNAEIKVYQAEKEYYAAQEPASEVDLATAAAQVKQAQATLRQLRESPTALAIAQAEAKVRQAEYNLAQAQDTLAKIESGPSAEDIRAAEAQVAQAEYNLAQALHTLAKIESGPSAEDVRVAEAQVVNAQANLDEAKAALAAATMVAPFDGTIISVGAEVGDTVSTGQVIITIADLEKLQILATIDETDISQVEVGQPVQITFDAFPNRRFSGRVLEVPLQGTLSQSIVVYSVPISLEGAEGTPLKAGMTANLTIIVGRSENALLVPAMAVQQGETGSVVRLQDAQTGATVMTPVEVGLSDGTYAEILSGLKVGDRVAVSYSSTEQMQTIMQWGGNRIIQGGMPAGRMPSGGGQERMGP